MTVTLVFAAISTGCCGENSKRANTSASEQESSTAGQQHEVTTPGVGVLKQDAGQGLQTDPDNVMEAALNGEIDFFVAAIENGLDVNTTDEEQHTALMMAAYNGHSKIVSMLLDNGAIPDARDNMDRTALMYASTGAFNESVKLLLDAGADPNLVDNSEHFTALMFAAAEGQKEVVNTLLEYGADKTLLDKDGESALDFAIANNHPEVASLLK